MVFKANEPAPPAEISLRPATAADSEFLLQAYTTTRQDEMASWGWNSAQQAAFVRMQFDARQRGYMAQYPQAKSCVICVGESPAGSIIISRGQDEIRLVDITVLPEFRNRGVGGHLIEGLIDEASRAGRALRLTVLQNNRAKRLYERVGFVAKGGDDMYCEMEWAAAKRED